MNPVIRRTMNTLVHSRRSARARLLDVFWGPVRRARARGPKAPETVGDFSLFDTAVNGPTNA